MTLSRLYGGAHWTGIWLLCCVAAGCELIPSWTTTEPPAATRQTADSVSSPALVEDPRLQREVLQNGVTFLHLPQNEGAKHGRLSLVVRTGSAFEQPGEGAYAHLIEHLAFLGTKSFSRQRQQSLFDQVGISLGLNLGGTTYRDYTRYFVEIPTSDPALVEQFIALLAEWASAIQFEEPEVQAAKSIVVEERRRKWETIRTRHQLMKQLLPNSLEVTAVARATPTVIAAATAAGLESFYRRWYHPEDLAIVTVGDFAQEPLRHAVHISFGAIARPTNKSEPSRPKIAVSPGEQFSLLQGTSLPAGALVALLRNTGPVKTEADVRRGQLDTLVIDIANRRLSELARREPVVTASSTLRLNLLPRRIEAIGLYSVLGNGSVSELLRLFLQELRGLRLSSPSNDEIQLARASLSQAISTPPETAKFVAKALVTSFASEQPAMSPQARTALEGRLLADITANEVRRHLREWLEQSQRHVLVIPNDKNPSALSEIKLRKIATAVEQEQLPPYELPLRLERLMPISPVPGGIVQELFLTEIDATQWTLENGARVVFRKKNTGDSPLRLLAFGPGGLTLRGPVPIATARLAPAAVSHAGLGSHAASSSEPFLAERKVQLSPYLDLYEEGLTGFAHLDQLETLFQAVHLMVARPGQDATGFDRYAQGYRWAGLERLALPREVLKDAIAQALWAGQPLQTPLPPDAFKQVRLPAARKFFQDRFSDVGDFVFLLYGDAPISEVKTLTELYLASLPGTKRQDSASTRIARPREGITQVRLSEGPENRATVWIEFHGDSLADPAERMMMHSLSQILHGMLMETLREKLQGTYAIDAWALPGKPSQSYFLGFKFDCKPARASELKAAAMQVIRRLRVDGPPSGLVERTRGTFSTRGFDSVGQDFWIDSVSDAFRRGNDPTLLPAAMSKAQALTVEAIRGAAAQYLSPDRYVDGLTSGTLIAN